MAGQTPAGPFVVDTPGLPAIDRGLRAWDATRGPGRSGRAVTRPEAPDTGPVAASVIVRFRDDAPTDTRLRTLSAIRGTRAPKQAWSDFEVVHLPPGSDPEAVATALAARPDIDWAQPRYRVQPQFVPNDPLYPRQWNFQAIDMERAWDINRGASSQIVVAVLDSGMAYRNATVRFTGRTLPPFPALGRVDVPFAAAPELGGPDRFVAPRDFIWNTDTPLDMDGHGTHIAGTIGQVTNNGAGVAGMAFNVRLMPVKVIDGDWDAIFNSPRFATDDVIAQGIRYAADNGAHILNLSLGRDDRFPAPAVRSAIEYAVHRGVFVVVAGGNEFTIGNPPNPFADFANEIQGMVSVAATGRTNRRAFYSNTGPYVEIAAPGGDTRRDGPTGGILQQTYDIDFVDRFFLSRFGPPRFDVFAYEFYEGSSMAVPHVAGFAALLMQQGITSPAAIEAVMKATATDLGAPGRDNEYGHGLINPRAALRGLGLLK
ncbi:MAG: S8 family serine peptidase [Alphaproteobacteria bacterium]